MKSSIYLKDNFIFFFGTTQTNLSTKQKLTHRHRNQTFGCQGGGAGGGKAWEFNGKEYEKEHINIYV